MKTTRKLISSSENHFIYFIYQNKYIGKEDLTINLLPKITYIRITNRHQRKLPLFNTKRHIITFGWLMFDITIDYCYNLNKNYYKTL